MSALGQAEGAPFAGPYVKVKAVKPRSAGTSGTLSYGGQRPWPGIAGPHCYYCSWAYRGRWPFGRMEVKHANSACPVYAHSHPVAEES